MTANGFAQALVQLLWCCGFVSGAAGLAFLRGAAKRIRDAVKGFGLWRGA